MGNLMKPDMLDNTKEWLVGQISLARHEKDIINKEITSLEASLVENNAIVDAYAQKLVQYKKDLEVLG